MDDSSIKANAAAPDAGEAADPSFALAWESRTAADMYARWRQLQAQIDLLDDARFWHLFFEPRGPANVRGIVLANALQQAWRHEADALEQGLALRGVYVSGERADAAMAAHAGEHFGRGCSTVRASADRQIDAMREAFARERARLERKLASARKRAAKAPAKKPTKSSTRKNSRGRRR